MIRDEFLHCYYCDEDLCEFGKFTCKCDDIPMFVGGKNKCDVCESSGYDCECSNNFIIECPIIED